MSGFAQVLLEDYKDKLDANGVESLQEIHTNAVRMGALIDALFSLSRVARSDLTHECVNLSALARTITHELAVADPIRTVHIPVQHGLFALMDQWLARTLLANLLGNAWKFTGHVPVPRIEFAAVERDGIPTLLVRNNGAGFYMAHVGKLFAPFQRLHTVSEFPGTGIGLATAQRIVQRHGGCIWAEASISQGATFYFTLPGMATGGTQ